VPLGVDEAGIVEADGLAHHEAEGRLEVGLVVERSDADDVVELIAGPQLEMLAGWRDRGVGDSQLHDGAGEGVGAERVTAERSREREERCQGQDAAASHSQPHIAVANSAARAHNTYFVTVSSMTISIEFHFS